MKHCTLKTNDWPGPEIGIYHPGILKAIKENRLAMAGIGIVILLVSVAVLAPQISPYDPFEQVIEQRLCPPSWRYPLGTDDMGRCILSRLIYGTRITLQTCIIVSFVTAFSGTFLGLVSGYFGGRIDELIMRVTDVFLAFPGLILVLVVTGILGPGLFNIILALSMTGWTRYARLVRGCVLSVKERRFVESARAIGCGNLHIILRYVLPEPLSAVIVLATLSMGWTILSVAALSFLGLGIRPPTPEWGSMLNSGRAFLRSAPHLTAFPGLAIMVTVMAFNFIGDGLRDALDPKQMK
jgi:peptide/nickel transport system permease protein